MNDMNQAIQPKSDQWNADDLIAGPRSITITDVIIKPGQDQPVSISFEGSPKFFRPCKSMSRVLVNGWGPDAKAYIGRSLTLYRDPKVKWGGMEVGGIRISHMSDIEKPMNMVLTVTKATRAPYVVKPMDIPKQEAPKRDMNEMIALAMTHATKGKDQFVIWWNSDEGKDCRAEGLAVTEGIRNEIDAADAKSIEGEDEFGLPPITDPTPTAEEMAAAEAAALEVAGAEG